MAPFIELAHAVRETHTIGLQTLAVLTGITGVDPDDIEAFRARKARLLEAADLLVELSPYEPLIRAIVRTGGLAELPEYSADVAQLRVGANALWLGEVVDLHPTECEVAFQTLRMRTRAWVSRAKCIGIEKPTPSMWLRPLRPEPPR